MDNLLELVSLSLPTLDGEPFTTSTMIANHAEVKHYAVQQLIKKYTHDLQEFAKVAFEMQPVPSRQRTKIYLLNEQQATLIITHLGNTALVQEFKKAMARQFYATRKELTKRRSSREIEKPTRRSLTRAVTIQKYADPWSYKIISGLLCKAITGMTTKQLRVALGIAEEVTGLNSYSAG